MNDFIPWQEWGELCDSALCSESSRAELYKFARINWNAWLDKESGGGDVPEESEVVGTEPWQRFESHCAVKQTAAGKSYKSWLFERVSILPNGTPADKVRSGASVIMRTVVREFLRKEGRFRLRRFSQPEPSLSDTPPNASEGLTYEDLLSDTVAPGQEVELRDLQRIATTEARKVVDGSFNERQRIVFTAAALRIALSNPEVERLAGCKKSVLSDTLNKTLREIAATIHRDYAEDDLPERALLIRFVQAAIFEICTQSDNQPEIWKARLFSLAADPEP
jgi:hypothetical protein